VQGSDPPDTSAYFRRTVRLVFLVHVLDDALGIIDDIETRDNLLSDFEGERFCRLTEGTR